MFGDGLGPARSPAGLGLDCMGRSDYYGELDDAESIATIDRALKLGVTFLDMADAYGVGRNEELVGQAIAGRRDGVVLATKFGSSAARMGPLTPSIRVLMAGLSTSSRPATPACAVWVSRRSTCTISTASTPIHPSRRRTGQCRRPHRWHRKRGRPLRIRRVGSAD